MMIEVKAFPLGHQSLAQNRNQNIGCSYCNESVFEDSQGGLKASNSLSFSPALQPSRKYREVDIWDDNGQLK